MRRVRGSKPHDSNSSFNRPRKRKLKEADVVLSKKRNTSDNNMRTIDKLTDDLLIDILSRLPIKEAARTSLLAHRWRNLWKYTHGKLEFDAWPNCKGIETNITKFKSLVDNVVRVHKGSNIDAFIVRFDLHIGVKCHTVDRWIQFAMSKQPKVFELILSPGLSASSRYVFPNVEELSLHSHHFSSLTTLRLIGLSVRDSMVGWFLASCPNLEHLCISKSRTTKNVRIVDPLPKLKTLEVSECYEIESLEISVASLRSCTYEGRTTRVPFKDTPKLSELTIGGRFCYSFLSQPKQHSCYSGQLVKLAMNFDNMVPHNNVHPIHVTLPQLHSLEHLEVETSSEAGRSLLFFTLLIEKCPLLREFRIKIDYELDKVSYMRWRSSPFPSIDSVNKFSHESLKVVEIMGFAGSLSEKKFLSKLCRRAPFLELIKLDTTYGYEGERPSRRRFGRVMPEENADANWRVEAKETAEKMKCTFPPRIKLEII